MLLSELIAKLATLSFPQFFFLGMLAVLVGGLALTAVVGVWRATGALFWSLLALGVLAQLDAGLGAVGFAVMFVYTLVSTRGLR